jgi:hypothetical protein
MRLLTTVFCYLLFLNGILEAQSIEVSETPNTRSFSNDQFLVAGHQVDLTDRGLDDFENATMSSISAISAVKELNSIVFISGSGKVMKEKPYNFASDDRSSRLYIKPNGELIIRENIANFIFLNTDGTVKQSISNSSQSPEGESVSELAADPMFKTVVLYNPKIVRDGREGSRASVVKARGQTTNIFYSSDRFIKEVFVSDEGHYIAIVTAASGTDDQVYITDRFGKKLGEFSFNQPIGEVKFTRDGRYITIRSNGRVGVYSITAGEREGSTSFKNMLHYANYVPEDDNIIAITAERTGNILSEIEFHAINLTKRSIERQEYSENVGVTELLHITMERTGTNNYIFTGLSKVLNVSVQF